MQDSARATIARRLEKEDGRIDWNEPAPVIERRVRALDPWPGTFTTFRDSPLKIHRVAVIPSALGTGTPALPPAGTLALHEGRPIVGTGDGALALLEVQAAGKSRLSGIEWLRGARASEGETFEERRS